MRKIAPDRMIAGCANISTICEIWVTKLGHAGCLAIGYGRLPFCNLMAQQVQEALIGGMIEGLAMPAKFHKSDTLQTTLRLIKRSGFQSLSALSAAKIGLREICNDNIYTSLVKILSLRYIGANRSLPCQPHARAKARTQACR